jgi:hypothetical protein
MEKFVSVILDAGSGMEKFVSVILDAGSGMEKFVSLIRDKHPRSVTLLYCPVR